MALTRQAVAQCTQSLVRSARPSVARPCARRTAPPCALDAVRTFTSTRRARSALPWFVDAEDAPPATPTSDAGLIESGPRLATAPVPTRPPAHLSPALHPLHDFLSTSPFLDKDSLVYIHAREADPEASWCDWIVCASLRHGRERGLRGAIEGVKRHLAAHPVELPTDPDSATYGSAPLPFAPPSSRPNIHGLPTAPTKHARSRSLRNSRSSSNSPSASDAGTGWALLDAGTLVVHVFTPQARETYGRNIEMMWEKIGESEHRARGGQHGEWKSSARREEDRRRAQELEQNMREVQREIGQRFRPKVESQAAPLGEEDEGETQEESGGGWSAIFSSPSSVKHPRQSWTQDELATLERLPKLGRSFAQIAKALGRSMSSVERQCYHHHTGHRIDWTDDLDKQRLTAAGKGAMLKQLGSLLGVSPMSAQRRLKKLRSDDDSE
ncbi:hypothetical protein BMF94_0113 [Rhodotorula taiwanensis]|uniref:Myb-like domain-containing protein n=1 Tax=Rhodotorula taiwanensis TaxID=741276 RepID=A0A2S5BJC6_9BASI|nr:hypothetical protein BMF94_0113 [Rhodotorula taiwanensis]